MSGSDRSGPDRGSPGRVCVLHTGGTIGMTQTDAGLVPDASVLERVLAHVPQLAHPDVPPFDLVPLEPLLDSAEMRPVDWSRIADAVSSRYQDYAGFVVLHGTDTMAYSASALSFLLGPVGKPVVFTGAQLSLDHVRSDGREHLTTALILAGHYALPEVCIYFGNKLLRGNRAQKVSSADFVAFESGNYPPLATVGTEIRMRPQRAARGPLAPLRLVQDPEVAAVRLYPGMSARTMTRLLADIDAVVLETYGTGNFPTRDADLMAAVRAAVDQDVVVVNCSQCHSGAVMQALYSTGARLAELGVVSGHDMTPEAALTKLYCLLGAGKKAAEVRELMGVDLVGEVTVPGE